MSKRGRNYESNKCVYVCVFATLNNYGGTCKNPPSLRLCFTLLYLVSWVGGVHDTAQLLACVNHNPHHCAWREGEKEKKKETLKKKKMPWVNVKKKKKKGTT